MPDSDIVTRCPQCNTAFRVTPNQLAVADGVVRCGSCLAVFKAIDYKAKNEAGNKQKRSTTTRDENNIRDDDLDDDSGTIEDDTYDLDSNNKQKKTSLFDRKLQPNIQLTRERADESWAIDMLAEIESDQNIKPLNITRPVKAKIEESKPTPKPFAKNKPLSPPATRSPKAGRSRTRGPKTQGSKANPSPDRQIILEDSPKQNVGIEELYFDHDTDGDKKTEVVTTKSVELDHTQEQKTKDFSSISDEEIESAMHIRTNYASDYLAGIEPAPVEIEWLDAEGARRWLWLGGTVLAAVILIIQLAIYRFDTLGKHPSYRPFYQAACSVLECELPSLINHTSIRTTNLVVRSHPSEANALIVDAILINTAQFQQPYPALRLEFSDLNNALMAARNLQPKDYLRGELAGAKEMPVNQPIQLSLAIVDPGDTAVNYQLSVIKAVNKDGK